MDPATHLDRPYLEQYYLYSPYTMRLETSIRKIVPFDDGIGIYLEKTNLKNLFMLSV